MRASLLAVALLLLLPAQGWAEWQLKPFLGVTFGGSTTFFDLEHAAGRPNFTFGVNGAFLVGVVGVDGDLSFSPGFFQARQQKLVVNSSVTTATGNLVVTLPRRWTQYTIRPYLVGGAGVMHVVIDDVFGLLVVRKSLPTLDVGGGATGFLSDRIGVNWDLRYFRSFGGESAGLSVGNESLSYWRATMAIAIRAGRKAP
jgi:hypothetical protein